MNFPRYIYVAHPALPNPKPLNALMYTPLSLEKFGSLMNLSLWGTRGYPCPNVPITRKRVGILQRLFREYYI